MAAKKRISCPPPTAPTKMPKTLAATRAAAPPTPAPPSPSRRRFAARARVDELDAQTLLGKEALLIRDERWRQRQGRAGGGDDELGLRFRRRAVRCRFRA